MNAECSLSLDSEGSFLVAQVLVVTPPGLTGVQVFQPYETLWPNGQFVGLSSSPPYEAIAWAFVVTRDKAVPVAAASLTATNPSGHIGSVLRVERLRLEPERVVLLRRWELLCRRSRAGARFHLDVPVLSGRARP